MRRRSLASTTATRLEWWTNSSESAAPTGTTSVVLDASSLLAVVLNEPGAETVKSYIRTGATISSINLAEVVSRLARDGLSGESIQRALTGMTYTVIALSVETAWNAGLVIRQTSSFGLSLGARCCLALARELNLPVLTADRVWAQLDVGVEIVVCR